MDKPKLDKKIVDFPKKVKLSDPIFLATTIVKNLSMEELTEFHGEFVKQANQKMEGRYQNDRD
jgi:hypothetical protein